MKALKNVGWVVLGISMIAGLVFVAALLSNGMAWASGHVLEYLITLNNIVTVICLVLLLPLAPFRKTRIVPAYGLYVASFVVRSLLMGVRIYGSLSALGRRRSFHRSDFRHCRDCSPRNYFGVVAF